MDLHGGIITKRPLCYSQDGRLFLAPCGSEIRVYSAKSGDHIATLKGHMAEVTAVVADPSSSKLVLSSSLDGTMRQWDIQEGTNLHTWTVGHPIESMVFSKQAGLAYASVHYKSGSGRVVPLLLPSGEEEQGRIKISQAGQLVLSPSGAHVAVIDRNSLFVWAAGCSSSGRRAKPLNLPHTKPYTCAAFDSSDSMIAAGDASGRILIWHDFRKALDQWTASAAAATGAAEAGGAAAAAMEVDPSSGNFNTHGLKLPACTTVHWHAHAVGAVCFSLDGCYLLSGGLEAVLVQWALPTNKRSYLPRLGGPIRGITTSRADPAKFLVAQSDNTVRLINTASMVVELSVHGLRPAPAAAALQAAGYGFCCSSAASSPGGAVLQPGSGSLVLPAEHAMLQFFDVLHDRHLARLQVSPRNPVSFTEAATNHPANAAAGQAGAAPVMPAVVLLAFTGDGSALITVDVRPATGAYAGVAAEATLRFWDRSSEGQVASSAAPYSLNTSADNPHRAQVTGLACHPWQHLAVTTGSEGEFKLWVRSANKKARTGSSNTAAAAAAAGTAGSGSHWRCSSIGSYKDSGLNGCAFSHDGSLLAVAAGTTATLWDPQQNTLLGALCCPSECSSCGSSSGGDKLRQLVFMQHSPHLVGVVGGGEATNALASVGMLSQHEQQQQQQSRKLAAAVQNSWGSSIVVWDLLTAAVTWYCSLPVCSLAADPVHPVFAVGVPAVLPVGAALEQQQQQGGHGSSHNTSNKHRGISVQPVRGLVLIFSPTSPTPLLASPVPDSSPASLLFMPAAGSTSSTSEAPHVSPVLLLTDDRRYTRLSLPATAGAVANGPIAAAAAAAVPAGTRAAMEAELAAGADESALEAMFGTIDRPATVHSAAASDAAAAAEKAAAIKAAVSQLFDAPSHVLPAPSTLCPTLLELLVGAGRK